MNYLNFQKSPDKSQISYFLLCNYIGLFIPVARLESDRLLKHAQSLQLAGDKSHTILPGLAKLYIRENKILLSTSGGAICRQTRQYAYFIHKCLFGVTNCSV